jgi:hypothetical protein
MKMEQTLCSETSAYKIQTPGNYPEESIQHSEHGESLKTRTSLFPFKELHRFLLGEYFTSDISSIYSQLSSATNRPSVFNKNSGQSGVFFFFSKLRDDGEG